MFPSKWFVHVYEDYLVEMILQIQGSKTASKNELTVVPFMLCKGLRPSEPESLWAAVARNLNLHLIPGHSYVISRCASLDWSLGSTWQRKRRGKKEKGGNKNQRGKKWNKKEWEEEGGRREEGWEEEGELGFGLQSIPRPTWANAFLTSSLASVPCRAKVVSSMNICWLTL